MKRLSSLLAAVLLSVLAAPCATHAAARPANDDTILVKLPNQAMLTLVTKNKAQLQELRTYHLDSLMVLLDQYISQADALSKSAGKGSVTMEFYPAKDHPGTNAPEQVRVTVRNDETTPGSTTKHLGRYIRVNVEDSKATKAGKKGNVSINLGDDDDPKSDSLRAAESKRKRDANTNKVVHSNVKFDLGLNTLVNRAPFPDAAGANQTFDLSPTGSRYASIGYYYDIRVGGKASPLHLRTGPEVAFNNYMFENNRRLVATDQRTDILHEPTLGLQKSKLAVTTLNLPLTAGLNFRDKSGHSNFRLNAGGYVGYRLSSHTKIKYEADGNTRKDKDRGSYNLEEFQYGLQGGIGVRGIDLFVKYGLNDLFKTNRGPQGQTVSFGISL